MQNVYEKLISCYESIREKIPFTPRVALVLGSGLGDYAEEIRVEAELDYHEIDGFPVSTVPGHAGKFIFGWIGSVPVVCMKGRVHFYEGYPVSDVVLPIRLMKRMGAELLFLTNASGGINPSFSAGDLMLLTDHISLFAPNPLIGQNFDELGVRFPDMTQDLPMKHLQRWNCCAGSAQMQSACRLRWKRSQQTIWECVSAEFRVSATWQRA